jgi:hypothetical protein
MGTAAGMVTGMGIGMGTGMDKSRRVGRNNTEDSAVTVDDDECG